MPCPLKKVAQVFSCATFCFRRIVYSPRKLDDITTGKRKKMSAETELPTEKETDMRRQNEFFSVLEQKGLLTDFQQKWMQQGVQQGVQQGIQQGMRRRAEAIARNMKEMGMDVNTIAKATGLFVDDILRL